MALKGDVGFKFADEITPIIAKSLGIGDGSLFGNSL